MKWEFLVACVVAGAGCLAGTVQAQGVLYRIDGESADLYLGTYVSDVGDVDGDGYPDIVTDRIGYVRVYSGRDRSLIYELWANNPWDFYFPASVAGAGDVNNDGFPDIIAGAIDAGHILDDPGRVHVFSGADGSLLWTKLGPSAGDEFGQSVDGVGDLDGDGFDEVLVGAPRDWWNATEYGSARVLAGPSGSVMYTIPGDSPNDQLGYSISGTGDVDNDGVNDLVVGAPYADPVGSGSGIVRLYSGSNGALVRVFNGYSPGDLLGWSVGGAGDVNGDGVEDILAGARGDDDNGISCGSVQIFSGFDGATLYTFYGAAAGDEMGESVSGAGDFDGDGYPDVIGGAGRAQTNGPYSGMARIWSGADGGVMLTLVGQAGDGLGWRVSRAGDVNQDGRADMLVGAGGTDFVASDSGSVYVISGTCGWITTYGGGCPGTGGVVPALSIAGCASPGGAIDLSVTNGLGGAPALVFVSNAQVSLPLGQGCTLLVFPLLQIHGIGLGGSGAGNGDFEQAVVLPMETPLGAITLQAVVLDAGGAKGYAMTNGVAIEVE